MPYNFVPTVFTQRNFVADFFQVKCIFKIKIGRFAFLRPPLGDLGATYDDRLSLIGKRLVYFLLALIELFSLGVLRLRRYERLFVENRRFRSNDFTVHRFIVFIYVYFVCFRFVLHSCCIFVSTVGWT